MAYCKQSSGDNPIVEPVTVAQFLAFMNLPTGFAPDGDLTPMIAGARREGERICGRALAKRKFTMAMDSFPAECEIKLGYPPLVSVESITYKDPTGTPRTLTVDVDYDLDVIGEPGRIGLLPGRSWPATRASLNAVVIEYTAGYETLPYELRMGVLNLAAFWFQNRGATHSAAAIGAGFKTPPYIENIFACQQILDFLPTP